MKKNRQQDNAGAAENLYDFSGPLWSKYFKKTRNNARFPRSYREVFSIDESESPSEAY
ncbi:MAG: hypothetical protein ACFCUH_06440 [Flavobacteriales bacterium]|jgi:hypothetical protein